MLYTNALFTTGNAPLYNAKVCLDYSALNKFTIKNKCPLPRIYEIFDRLQEAQYFTSLDLRSGYYQIRMKDADIPKTCIRTRHGSFEFLVMPYGLTKAPSTFQAVMNNFFREYLDDFVMIYIDDIPIFSRTAENHLRHVRIFSPACDNTSCLQNCQSASLTVPH
jgi:Reverse transcriptase (RNA-dependent DNA polymerase)